jgi:hypothetical protein
MKKVISSNLTNRLETESDIELERELKRLLSEHDRESNSNNDTRTKESISLSTSSSSNTEQEWWWIEAEVKASLSSPTSLHANSASLNTSITQLVTRLRTLHGIEKPLSTLLHALHSYSQRLQNNVVNVIGQQYPAFLLLYRRQAHLLSLIHMLRPSLVSLSDEVAHVLNVLDQHLNMWTHHLTQRRELRYKRRLCETFLTISERIERNDSLLERLRSIRKNTSTSTARDMRPLHSPHSLPIDIQYEENENDYTLVSVLLERIATHIVTIKQLLVPYNELPFSLKIDSVSFSFSLLLSLSYTHSLSISHSNFLFSDCLFLASDFLFFFSYFQRLTAQTTEVMQILRNELIRVLESIRHSGVTLTTHSTLCSILRTFAILADSSAYELIRTHFVVPRLHQVCDEVLRSLTTNTPLTLEPLFSHILQFIEHDCRYLFQYISLFTLFFFVILSLFFITLID